MGTSVELSSHLTDYYKQGNNIPGIRVDGMDVLAVKEAIRYAKAYALENGPIFLEMKTYRYHGHSMSDPGIAYRSRDEVATVRKTKDPIEHVKALAVEKKLATVEELKAIEKEARAEVAKALKDAKASSQPDPSELISDIFTTGEQIDPTEVGGRLVSERVREIRMPDVDDTHRA